MTADLRREFLRKISSLGAAGALSVAPGHMSAADVTLERIKPTWPMSKTESLSSIVPMHLDFAPGDIRRYGADPSGMADSTQAFVNANSVATSEGKPFRIPAGTYRYSPLSTMNISVSWSGDGSTETVILCDTTKFSGEFFRVLGSTEIRDLLLKATGPKRVGTGIRLAPLDVGLFTGHVRLTRVWIIGFNYNIQSDNNFEVTFDQVRSVMGNEGFYCAPETASGNGYCTTHLHLNCYYAQNVRNVFYAPSFRFACRTITFLGGAIEGATGNSCQSSFTRCSPLKFIQIYLEDAPRIPALVLDECIVSIEGAFLNNTGGIKLGAKTRADLRQVVAVTPSDVFSGAGGTQHVSMQGCLWPSSGNRIDVAGISLRHTSINGISYQNSESEISSMGGIRFDRQSTLVSSIAAQDVYRFLSVAGDVASGPLSGRLEIVASDKGDFSNQAVYEYWIGSTSGGPKYGSLVQLQRLVRGVDVGSSLKPFSLAADGDRGGVKLQFSKNTGLPRVVVDVSFHGATNFTYF